MARIRFNPEWILNGTPVEEILSILEGPSLRSTVITACRQLSEGQENFSNKLT